jgi:thiosulfate dehydrogenase [quinone] large subunit
MVAFLHTVEKGAPEFYRQFIDTVVVPNAPLFAWAVVAGELYVGIALALGLTSRLAALVGIALVTNFMLSKGNAFWLPTNNDALFILILLTIILTGAGRVWGVDRWLAKKWPRGPLW